MNKKVASTTTKNKRVSSTSLIVIGVISLAIALLTYPLLDIVVPLMCTRTALGGCELGFAMSSWLTAIIIIVTSAIISLCALSYGIYMKSTENKKPHKASRK